MSTDSIISAFKKPQTNNLETKIIKFKDKKIAETTPFGPMSAWQEKPENRIIHKSVREEKKDG